LKQNQTKHNKSKQSSKTINQAFLQFFFKKPCGKVFKENCKNLQPQLANSNFKSVYIRPDRTVSEQAEFNRLHKELKEASDDLAKHNLLNNPFRFVIRGDRVRCVDVKETLDNNKHPFVQWKIACYARKGKTPNTQ
jgi:hypothetical protein